MHTEVIGLSYISYFDIPVSDLENAKKFYSKLFGWKIEKVSDNYMSFECPYPPNGGFVLTNDIPERGITPYVIVEDIDDILDKVLDLGGRISISKTLISDEVGHKAEFIDDSGNRIAIISPPKDKAKKPKKAKKKKK